MKHKQHLTNRGNPIDMAALQAQNENVRAVGNMNVNARGDVIDGSGQVIKKAKTEGKRVQAKPRTAMGSLKADPVEKPEKFYTPAEIMKMAEEATQAEEAQPKKKRQSRTSKAESKDIPLDGEGNE